MIFKIIVAMDNHNGIGKNNSIPWKCKKDLKYFSKLTTGANKNAIIMGKNTYQSIGRPLPNRKNIILSTSLEDDDLCIFKNIDDLLNFLNKNDYEELWVIGGAAIYKQFLEMENFKKELFITYIENGYNCDVFFPEIPEKFIKRSETNFHFVENKKKINGYFRIYT